MRSEGFPFIVGGLGVGAVFAWLASRRRLSTSVVVCRRRRVSNSRPLGEAFARAFHGRVTRQFAPLLRCDLRDNDMSRKNAMHFAAQAQRFVRSAVCCAVPLGLALGESCFVVLDVAVPLGFAFQGVASKLGFRDKSQLKWRFWWMGVCSERVEIIPNEWCGANFVEAHMR